jgi:Sec-independent protein translocase protein TatA
MIISNVLTLFAFFSFGLPETCIVGGLVLILFLGPKLHQSIRGITRMPAEFLRGKRERKTGLETEKQKNV